MLVCRYVGVFNCVRNMPKRTPLINERPTATSESTSANHYSMIGRKTIKRIDWLKRNTVKPKQTKRLKEKDLDKSSEMIKWTWDGKDKESWRILTKITSCYKMIGIWMLSQTEKINYSNINHCQEGQDNVKCDFKGGPSEQFRNCSPTCDKSIKGLDRPFQNALLLCCWCESWCS